MTATDTVERLHDAEVVRLVRQEWTRIQPDRVGDYSDPVSVTTDQGRTLILVEWYEVVQGPRRGLTYCRHVRGYELEWFQGDAPA